MDGKVELLGAGEVVDEPERRRAGRLVVRGGSAAGGRGGHRRAVEPGQQEVDVVGAVAQCMGQLVPDSVGGCVGGQGMRAAEAFEMHVPLDVLTKLVSVASIPRANKNLVVVKSKRLVLVRFQDLDRPCLSTIGSDQCIAISDKSKHAVHFCAFHKEESAPLFGQLFVLLFCGARLINGLRQLLILPKAGWLLGECRFRGQN